MCNFSKVERTVYIYVPNIRGFSKTLLVEKAGVAPDLTLRFTARKQVSVQVTEPPWL